MKKTANLTITAVVALLLALALTLVAADWLWSVNGNLALQSLGGWLKLPMDLFTFLGDEQFYLVALPLVYWCLHKGLGQDLGVLLIMSAFANTALKSFIKHARPFWESASLGIGHAESFSTPSGHAQNSAALFGQGAWLVSAKRRGRLWAILLALLIVSVALSRVYLGVHFAGDILWGAAVGLTLLALYHRLKPRLLPWLKGLSLGVHAVLALVTASVMLGLVSLLLSIPFGSGQLFGELYTAAWSSALEDGATIAGLTIGLWIGLVLETRYVRFSVAGPWGQRLVRYVIGVAALLGIWLGLRVIFPAEPLALGLALRIVRYVLAMAWAIVIWPWLFVKVGLGTRG